MATPNAVSHRLPDAFKLTPETRPLTPDLWPLNPWLRRSL